MGHEISTERSDTTAVLVCDGITLIVAGGLGNDRRVVLTVEVMNTENFQWSTAANLLKPIYSASVTVCGNQLKCYVELIKTQECPLNLQILVLHNTSHMHLHFLTHTLSPKTNLC